MVRAREGLFLMCFAVWKPLEKVAALECHSDVEAEGGNYNEESNLDNTEKVILQGYRNERCGQQFVEQVFWDFDIDWSNLFSTIIFTLSKQSKYPSMCQAKPE